MMMSRVSAVLVLAAGLLLTSRANAAVNAFLKIDGVDGESTDDKHKGWIDVSSYSFDQLGQTKGSGKVSIHDITVSKKVDRATPAIFRACADGKHYPTATLSVRKAGGTQQEYLVIKLTDVLVSSYRTVGGGGAAGATETFTLNASDATLEYPGQPTPSPAVKASLGAASVVLASTAPTITKVTPSAASAAPGHVLTFTVEGSGDCNRSRIDYGDGSPVVEYPMVAGKSQPAPTHAFAKLGTFEVRAYGFADPWAKLPQAPKASDHACTGHATTSVAVNSPAVVAPALRR